MVTSSTVVHRVVVRALFLLFAFLAAGCHGGSRSSDSVSRERFARMDSLTAHRMCQSPDSVIAGTKDCVLLDQGRPADRMRPVTLPPRE
jgi:hypothetical protein